MLRSGGRIVAGSVLFALSLAACGDDDGTVSADGPLVVATTSIWADVVRAVACDDSTDVVTLIPPGGDPHAYEPSLADRGMLDDASLVVANGLGLEGGIEDTIEAAESGGTPVVRLAEQVDTLLDGEGHGDEDDHDEDDDGDEDDHDEDEQGDDDHAHDGADPHVWQDPTRVAATLDVLAERLVATVGLDAGVVEACLSDYRGVLAGVDREIAELVASLPAERRQLVTSHESLAYFADRYGFEVIGTVIPAPSTLAQVSAAELEELADTLRDTGVGAVFAEHQHSAADTEALAARVGDVSVVTLYTDSLGEPGSGADSYVGLLRTNAGLIVEALSR